MKNTPPLWILKMAVQLSARPTGVSKELKQRISDLGCIFIHIPKCAGNAVQKSLFGEVVFGHQTIRQYQVALPKSLYKKAWKFTITRNPWERTLSAWRFLKAGGLHAHDAQYFQDNLSQYPSFDHFVNDWLVYQDINDCGCVHFKPQVHYLMRYDGSIAMDSIIKLSVLHAEYEKLRVKFNGGELIRDNITRGDTLDMTSSLVSGETYQNISQLYAEDIARLGYSD